ncbi:hypothetical protein KZX47_10340 [Thermus sp. SYSU G05001]|uniref:MipA/OmpV family protein n=1 Tax=Thermus brevis TaxID=2862456 RepID=A0ABS6ZZP9_9DEIN|nr:hypothetical protein [Thermus brevis]MBW6395547.1 hypothetical protein [Thermus brevis]
MKRWILALAAALGLAWAQSVEVGGELAPDGLRPYVLLSWSQDLGGGLYLVPSVFFYPSDLEATLRRGWFSLQLLHDTPLFTVGVEGYLRGLDPAVRFFLRVAR